MIQFCSINNKVKKHTYPIETSVRSWKILDCAPLLDTKRFWPVWSSESAEAFVRNARSASDELEEFESVFVVKFFDVFPEELDCIVRVKVSSSVLLERYYFDILNAIC